MKKTPIIIIVSIIALTAIGFGLYTLTVQPTTTSTPPSASVVSPQTSSSPEASNPVTASELAKNNGQNGSACWIAVNGTVYDVTGNAAFGDGTHKPYSSQVQCGQDESAAIGKSPHGESVLSKLPVIGPLAN